MMLYAHAYHSLPMRPSDPMRTRMPPDEGAAPTSEAWVQLARLGRRLHASRLAWLARRALEPHSPAPRQIRQASWT